jgi:hypothetical protein
MTDDETVTGVGGMEGQIVPGTIRHKMASIVLSSATIWRIHVIQICGAVTIIPEINLAVEIAVVWAVLDGSPLSPLQP